MTRPTPPRSEVEVLFVRKRRYPDHEWFEAQLAVRGIPSIPFQIHASDRERFRNEDEWIGFLSRKAEELIEQYGDARAERPGMDDGLTGLESFLAA